MDIAYARDFTIELSVAAGKILKDYFISQKFHQETKGHGDIVTQADIDTDTLIRETLTKQFPDVTIMTEETTSGDYRFLKKNDWVFIVDPLDGTINFTHGIPHFGVSIGLMNKGDMKMCVAHLPMENQTYWADSKTEGAFLNGEKISVSNTSKIEDMVIACDWSNNKDARKNMVTILHNLTGETRKIKCLGSPVADLCLVAEGKIDGYIHPRLRPWDITPGYIVRKAGGTVTNFKRTSWDIFRLDIVAGNDQAHNALAKFAPFASSLEIS